MIRCWDMNRAKLLSVAWVEQVSGFDCRRQHTSSGERLFSSDKHAVAKVARAICIMTVWWCWHNAYKKNVCFTSPCSTKQDRHSVIFSIHDLLRSFISVQFMIYYMINIQIWRNRNPNYLPFHYFLNSLRFISKKPLINCPNFVARLKAKLNKNDPQLKL